MLNLNSLVIYGNNGVCNVSDIIEENFTGETQKYYILKPVKNKSYNIYLPLNNEQLLKKAKEILSKDEVYELIDNIENEESIWIDNERVRNNEYKEILQKCDRRELFKLIKTLREKEQERMEKNKKLRYTDEHIMNNAKDILFEEFAYVLQIERDEVERFILNRIKSKV